MTDIRVLEDKTKVELDEVTGRLTAYFSLSSKHESIFALQANRLS